MNILMFDTSVESLSVGVARGDTVFCMSSSSTVKHAEILLPMIGDCLAKASLPIEALDLIACTCGPGSFTGLRIGMSTAKGLALARATPWMGLPTLDTWAAEFDTSGKLVVPLIDARKSRVYAALYKDGALLSNYLDIEPVRLFEMLSAREEEILLAGPGAAILADAVAGDPRFAIGESNLNLRFVHFAELAAKRFGESGPSPEDAAPLYIRDPEIG